MNETSSPTLKTFDPSAITRPHPVLMRYYILMSLLAGPLFIFPLIPLLFRYMTLEYRFDDKGIAMSWGVIFRREVLLTYRRIQDIHLTRNIVQRWLGLANVSVQTASGSAGAEMTIEGILEADALRDFLYERMRGARGLPPIDAAATVGKGEDESTGRGRTLSSDDEALALLHEIRDALARVVAHEERRP